MILLRKWYYILQEAITTFKRTPGLAIITITTLFFTLFILVIFIIAGISLNSIIESYKEHAKIVIYLKSPINLSAFNDIKDEFIRNNNVKSVEYISNEKALENLKNEWGRDNPIFQALPENPLPASIEIQLKRGAEEIDSIIELSKKVPGVDEIQYGQKTFSKLLKISKVIRTSFLFFGSILCFIVMLIVANTIKLTIVARADEIEIMRLVGAENWFVRSSFILEGIIYGVIGGLLTVICVKMFLIYLDREFELMRFLSFIETDNIRWMFYTVSLGIIIGFIGAVVSIVRLEANEE
ncbi:MAG: permease-like cell division protein FtsX [Candidatus Hydrogenedentota bacterium]